MRAQRTCGVADATGRAALSRAAGGAAPLAAAGGELGMRPMSPRRSAARSTSIPLQRLTAAYPAGVDRRHAKVLWALDDGEAIEVGAHPEGKRRTLCISSQAGCALGCVFCATGRMGFGATSRRVRSPGRCASWCAGSALKPTNVVFIGDGRAAAQLGRGRRDAHDSRE